MNIQHYLYTGPRSGASLRIGPKNELLDVQLVPGQPVDLPAEHDFTRVLLALHHLSLQPIVEPTEPPSPPADKKEAKPHAR